MIGDAPYIVEAEKKGFDDGPQPECPCCGGRCLVIYRVGSDVFGCDQCVDVLDAYEWMEEGRE